MNPWRMASRRARTPVSQHIRWHRQERPIKGPLSPMRHGVPCGWPTRPSPEGAATGMQIHTDQNRARDGLCCATEYHTGRLWRQARRLIIAAASQKLVLSYLSRKTLGLPKFL